ncbi:MAG: S9 family peptidase [Gemmatimonadales bacterium]|nr:S9 family peptidase [Gemmatimonadales bacterium]
MTTQIPPVARREPTAFSMHGETFHDDYAWMCRRDDPEVRAYLEAENAYGHAVLAPLAPLEATLYDEMLARIRQTDLSVPYRDGEYWYYSRTVEGQQYAIYARRHGSMEAPEEVLLDLNTLAEGHTFMGLGVYAISPDAGLLAYAIDTTGFREYTLHVKDLATGEARIVPVPRVGSFAWAADSRAFFYTVDDPVTKREFRMYAAVVDGGAARLVYEETDERFRVIVTRTRSRRYLVMYAASHITSEAHVLETDAPDGAWRVVSPRRQDREYDIEHHGDHFYIRVNDTAATFRVVSAPVAAPDEANWVEFLPAHLGVMLEGFECFAGHWVSWERSEGLPRIRVGPVGSPAGRLVEFGEEVYDVSPSINLTWETTRLRYRYESFVTSSSVYEYDMQTHVSVLLKRKEVLGDYDPSRYVSERLFAVAPDGVRVPISLVRLAGPTVAVPTYLTGYGAYGISYPVSFTSNRLSLLDRGVAFAVAHVRGGGELGRPWHDAGKLGQKSNSFTDFIAVADHLAAVGRTTPSQLVIEGGSAGGLLMGAVINARPDLASAAILQVPFVDVLNTMRDPTLPLTVGEYEEWGNPDIEEQFRWIRSYCPYTNLRSGSYPALLIRSSLNDSQVMYWEPAKYVAKLRTIDTDPRPVILLTNLDAGHSGASGRYDRLREIATDYAYVLWRVGLAG